MKKISLLAGLGLGMTLAQADIIPAIGNSQYIATARYNGSSISYAENRYGSGPLAEMAAAMQRLPMLVQNGLNTAVTNKASNSGGSFLRGSLTGDPTLTIAPQVNGVTFIQLSGWSYTAATRYTGKKLGIISYDCTNTLSLRNVSITGQYGAVDGKLQEDKIGVTADVSSSTDCDSNLSWILPFVGDFIIGQITSRLDAGFVASAQQSLGEAKDHLLFDRTSNYLSGLNKLVPVDKVIPLPNGSSFPLGQYIQNNLPYLIGNSQLTLKLGQGVQVRPRFGGEPATTTETGLVLDLSLSSPAFSFGVGMVEQAQVKWTWVCSWQNPTKRCHPDY
ncbi:hypothetical protein ACS5PK_13685 [Roseateles sp. DB2]|uniref:hypothetical protein n=1 Tax=Roseateles sp. DB2 TaxID=3453717 RepID=UPI003EE92A8F